MKKTVLVLSFLVCSLCLKAQQAVNPVVLQFDKYYNANVVDSIYTLFSSQMKSALTLDATGQFVSQLKDQLGNVVNVRSASAATPNVEEYRLSFEKPLVEIALMIQNNQIAGIRQKQVQPATTDPALLKVQDNFSVTNGNGNLYGTLVMPEKTGKVPVILLISGSGPTDRNMNQGEALRTNSFLQLADELSRAGIATVRYDKRGVGKSSAAMKSMDVTLDDFISDANLFVTKLKADTRFSKVIVLGHSEGAAIGLVTSLQTHPAAFISLSGYADNMIVLLRNQFKVALPAADYSIASQLLDTLQAGKLFKRDLPPSLSGIFSPANQHFVISTNKYQSTTEIAKLKIPVMIIGGTTDLQVPDNEAIKLAAAHKGSVLKILPGMNHVLKIAPADRTANLQTYNNPQLPVNPELTKVITLFVNGLK